MDIVWIIPLFILFVLILNPFDSKPNSKEVSDMIYKTLLPLIDKTVIITMEDGSTIVDELGVADAHPNGARPFKRANYIEKFRTLAEGVIDPAEQDRFLDVAQRSPQLSAAELGQLNFTVSDEVLARTPQLSKGLF